MSYPKISTINSSILIEVTPRFHYSITSFNDAKDGHGQLLLCNLNEKFNRKYYMADINLALDNMSIILNIINTFEFEDFGEIALYRKQNPIDIHAYADFINDLRLSIVAFLATKQL